MASYLTPKGNNIEGKGIPPNKVLDLPEASDFGNIEDKWVKNAEIFLSSLLDKAKDEENIKREDNYDINS